MCLGLDVEEDTKMLQSSVVLYMILRYLGRRDEDNILVPNRV